MNDGQATACSRCNFPLHPEGAAPEPAVRGFDPNIRRVRPIRPRPPQGPQQALQTQLWVVLGAMAVMIILFTAFKGFQQNNPPPAVPGAREEQQHVADLARAELAKDSTNINARIALANILYDTGNWPEAIIHYRSAQRTDPDRVETIVDLGVCYYNLADVDAASAQFKRALELNPKHPVALFNMGIVTEAANKFDESLKYYQRAMDSNPPESMRPPLQEAIDRVKLKMSGKAPTVARTSGTGEKPR
jgi:cytochrome c-type biogenesis protein CcmH/NrfG